MDLDPLHQFEIIPLIPLRIGSVDLSFTTSALAMAATVLLISLLLTFSLRRSTLIPTRSQLAVELLYNFVFAMVRDNAGSQARPFIPFVFTLFTYLLVGNLLGMIPGFFTFTSHIIVTFALGLTVIAVVTVTGFINHGIEFLRLFLPKGAPLFIAPILIPIELISYLVRPFSLAIRLFVNMMAGHTMLKVFAGFAVVFIKFLGTGFGVIAALVPVAITMALTGFEIVIAILQAYVFTVLTCLYLNDALDLH